MQSQDECMKTVAVISPDFTPSSMPNALRVRLLVEHLQEYGWEPVVIATDPQYYEQPADPENEALLRGKYEIIRTRAWPAQFTRRFGLGDVGLRSFYYQWRALSQLCRSRKVDLVFISVPPNYSMALGRLIHASVITSPPTAKRTRGPDRGGERRSCGWPAGPARGDYSSARRIRGGRSVVIFSFSASLNLVGALEIGSLTRFP